MIVVATILFTVVSCMAFGIVSGFLTISLILHLMSPKPQPVRVRETRTVAASGD